MRPVRPDSPADFRPVKKRTSAQQRAVVTPHSPLGMRIADYLLKPDSLDAVEFTATPAERDIIRNAGNRLLADRGQRKRLTVVSLEPRRRRSWEPRLYEASLVADVRKGAS